MRPRAIALLRARHDWQVRRRTAEKRDELAPLHSITSSARARSVGGTVRPSALAVLRLMTNSYLVGLPRRAFRLSGCGRHRRLHGSRRAPLLRRGGRASVWRALSDGVYAGEPAHAGAGLDHDLLAELRGQPLASERPNRSAAPPAANGTISLIGLFGNG